MQRSSLGAGRSISRPSLRALLHRPEIFTGCRARQSSAARAPRFVRETLDGDLRCAHGATGSASLSQLWAAQSKAYLSSSLWTILDSSRHSLARSLYSATARIE